MKMRNENTWKGIKDSRGLGRNGISSWISYVVSFVACLPFSFPENEMVSPETG